MWLWALISELGWSTRITYMILIFMQYKNITTHVEDFLLRNVTHETHVGECLRGPPRYVGSGQEGRLMGSLDRG